jgi:hypothetical protein
MTMFKPKNIIDETMQYVYGLSKVLKTCKVNLNEQTLQIKREVENHIEYKFWKHQKCW